MTDFAIAVIIFALLAAIVLLTIQLLETKSKLKRAWADYQDARKDNKREYIHKWEAINERKALQEKLDAFIILPAYAYKVTYWVDGELVVEAGIISQGDETLAKGLLYDKFKDNGRHLNITLYPLAEKK